jgi:hypothetical protein
VRVHLTREHALEFELLELRIAAGEVLLDRLHHAVVGVGFGHVEQFSGLVEPAAQLVERVDDRFELAALPAEFLRALRLLPDGRVFEFPQDFGEPLSLARIVKDTP